ncbi:MAG: RNase adapter RapZ, partial [Acidobacteriota bacterium]
MSEGNRLVIATGLSGSGKSYVAHALEDIGYATVDNLPLSLLEEYVGEVAADRTPRRRNAVVLDVRNPDFATRFPELLETLRARLPITVVFLDCEAKCLLNRFSETRRPHPLGEGRSV